MANLFLLLFLFIKENSGQMSVLFSQVKSFYLFLSALWNWLSSLGLKSIMSPILHQEL